MADKTPTQFKPVTKYQATLSRKQPAGRGKRKVQWMATLTTLPGKDQIEVTGLSEPLRLWLEAEAGKIARVQMSGSDISRIEAILLRPPDSRWVTIEEALELASKRIPPAAKRVSADMVKDPKGTQANPTLDIKPEAIPVAEKIKTIENQLSQEELDERQLSDLRYERMQHYLKLADILLDSNVAYGVDGRQKFKEAKEVTGTIGIATQDQKVRRIYRANAFVTDDRGEIATVPVVITEPADAHALNRLVEKNIIKSVRLSPGPNAKQVRWKDVLASVDGVNYTKLSRLLAKERASSSPNFKYMPLKAPITVTYDDIKEALQAKRCHADHTSLPDYVAEGSKLRIAKIDHGFLPKTPPTKPNIPTQQSTLLVHYTPPPGGGEERVLLYQTRTQTFVGAYATDDPDLQALKKQMLATKLPTAEEPSSEKIEYDPSKELDPRIEHAQKVANELIKDREIVIVHADYLRPDIENNSVKAFYPPSSLVHRYLASLTNKTFDYKPFLVCLTNAGLSEYKERIGELIAHEAAHGLQDERAPGQSFHHSQTWAKLAAPLVVKAVNLREGKENPEAIAHALQDMVFGHTLHEFEQGHGKELTARKKTIVEKSHTKIAAAAVGIAKEPGPISADLLLEQIQPSVQRSQKNQQPLTR